VEYGKEDLRKQPPDEAKAAETTIAELDPDPSRSLFSEFDFGDRWEHHIEWQETRERSLDGDPVIVDEHCQAPPQYPESDQ